MRTGMKGAALLVAGSVVGLVGGVALMAPVKAPSGPCADCPPCGVAGALHYIGESGTGYATVLTNGDVLLNSPDGKLARFYARDYGTMLDLCLDINHLKDWRCIPFESLLERYDLDSSAEPRR